MGVYHAGTNMPGYVERPLELFAKAGPPAILGVASGGIAYLGYQYGALLAEARAVGAMAATSAEGLEMAEPLLFGFV